MTTATRAPSLTHPRWNRKTVAAPAPPQTPPPRPTAKEAKPRPTRAPTVREVSRPWTLYPKWCPQSQPAGGIAAAAPIRWMPRHFLFPSPQPVPASASTKQPSVRENWGGSSLKEMFICLQARAPLHQRPRRERKVPRGTLCPRGRRTLQKANPLRYKHGSSGPLPEVMEGIEGWVWLVPISPCRTWKRRPRPVRRASWSPRLRILRRVRSTGLISFPSFTSSPSAPPPLTLDHLGLTDKPAPPFLLPFSPTEGEWILPLPPTPPPTPVLPSTLPHFSRKPREALKPRSCSSICDQGRRQTDLHLWLRATTEGLRTGLTPDAALRPLIFLL